jgi:hypothetical protein
VFRTKFVKTGASCISYKQDRLTHLGSPRFLFVEPVLLILLVFCITVYHCVSFRPVSCLSYVVCVCEEKLTGSSEWTIQTLATYDKQDTGRKETQ